MSDKKKRCERCGTDMTIYRKIYRASNQYYNNGLARAKVRDLSGAIISLKTSLELDKKNTNARNLLGLIYYEMGETVAALSEWVISRHIQPTENDAEEYINKVQSNPTKLDALNQAIKRYNTALTYAKQGSDDLSIIQLKKVVNLNPRFLRAYHLLALLLMKQKENDKAKKYLYKAAKIDVSNTMTLRYLKELEVPEVTVKDLDSNPEGNRSSSGAIMPISSYREDKPNIMVFVNLVIGIIIGIAVTAFLIVPTIEKRQSTSPDMENVDYSTSLAKIQEQEDEIASLKTDKTQLEQQIESLQGQIEGLKNAENKDSIYSALLEATQLYLAELEKSENSRDYIAIADLLATVPDAKYENADAVTLTGLLREVTYPDAAESHYDEGHDLYSDGKYEEAIKELEKALIFKPKDVNAIYFTGRAYQRLDDKENAALYYNIVLNEYPDSNRAADAQDFLKEVQE
jgi:tetratricopeptide (TPR) repeat protein